MSRQHRVHAADAPAYFQPTIFGALPAHTVVEDEDAAYRYEICVFKKTQ
jgi:hypothetical protein